MHAFISCANAACAQPALQGTTVSVRAEPPHYATYPGGGREKLMMFASRAGLRSGSYTPAP